MDVLAFNIGQRSYAIAIVVLNAAVVLLFIAVAVYTRLWANLPTFNYSDPASLIKASSLGGSELGNAIGDPASNAAGNVGIILKGSPAAITLSP